MHDFAACLVASRAMLERQKLSILENGTGAPFHDASEWLSVLDRRIADTSALLAAIERGAI
jgi:hypothetical protein